MKNNVLDFLVIAPTPFFANRGCHMRIRGEAEALQRKGHKVVVVTYKEGGDLPGLKIIRSPIGVGQFNPGVAATWKNLPAGFFLFWSVLYETVYRRPRVLYGHLFEGAAIGIVVKYLAIVLSLFTYKPTLVLDAQGSLSSEMVSHGMIRKGSPLFAIFRLIEKFILLFPDHIFASSLQCAEDLKKIRPRLNPLNLPDGISLFFKEASKENVSNYLVADGKLKALAKIAGSFSAEQKEQIENWLAENKTIVLYTGSYSGAKGFPAFVSSTLPKLLKNDRICFLFGGGEIKDVPGLDKLIDKNPAKLVSLANLNESNLLYFCLLGDIAVDCKPPMTTESSGKILNYMAAGLPVVCFSQKNNRFFLKEGGLFAKDYGFFTDNILALVTDNGVRARMGEMNLERAWKEFTWDKTAEQIINTLK